MLLVTAPRSSSKSHASPSPVSANSRDAQRGGQVTQYRTLPKATLIPHPESKLISETMTGNEEENQTQVL